MQPENFSKLCTGTKGEKVLLFGFSTGTKGETEMPNIENFGRY
jgi:hypothetical protein